MTDHAVMVDSKRLLAMLDACLAPYRDHLRALERADRITSSEYREVEDAAADRVLTLAKFLLDSQTSEHPKRMLREKGVERVVGP